jgi:AcrR family transcriptional regulator
VDSHRALPAESERERVLLATAELWAEEGYGGLGVTEICSRAEVDAGAFEAMFPSVAAAAKAAIEAPLAAVVGLVAELFSPDRSEAESYAGAIAEILKLMAANPAYAHLAYIAGRQMAPPSVRSVYVSGHHFLVAMLERLWESSGADQQPDKAALGVLGAAEAVVRREIAAGRHERLPALAPDFVYIATVPFLGQEEALRLARRSVGSRESAGGEQDGVDLPR